MKLYDILTKNGLINEVFRICSTNENVYQFRDVVSRLNDAINWYYTLAFLADERWNFDDINKTSPPIDTQNIVSGTNRYKMSDFTEKIFNLTKLEILDENGKGLELTPEVFGDYNYNVKGNASGRLNPFNEASFQELYIDAPSGTPTNYIKYGDYIYLRPNPNYSEADGLIAYFDRVGSQFTFKEVTFTDANPAVFTCTSHGLSAGDTVIFQTNGALSTNLTAGTTYYVIATGLTDDVFQVSATSGGSGIDTSGGGQSGIHAFIKTNTDLGIVPTHEIHLAKHASYPYLADKNSKRAESIASELGLFSRGQVGAEKEIMEHFAKRTRDMDNRFGIIQQNNK